MNTKDKQAVDRAIHIVKRDPKGVMKVYRKDLVFVFFMLAGLSAIVCMIVGWSIQ